MTNPIALPDVNETIEKVGTVADDLVTTREELEQQVSDRHKIDMLSDNWLSKSVRPIAFLSAQALFVITILCGLVLAWFEKSIDPYLLGAVIGPTVTYGGFYFNSRKGEKIAVNNARALVQMQEAKVKEKEVEVELERQKERVEIKRSKRMQKKLDRLKIKELNQELKEGK